MAKKEFPKKETKAQAPEIGGFKTSPVQEVKSRLAVFSGRFLDVFKFFLGLCIWVLVYSTSVALLNEFKVIDRLRQNYFWTGVVSFVILYLFIYEPAKIYQKGQKILEAAFRFFVPLVKVAPYLLPIYAIIAVLIYGIMAPFAKTETLLNYFMLVFGFTFALHLVFSAKSLRGKPGDFLKANYIFGFSFLYVINMMLVALVFTFIFDKFSLVNFCNNSFQIAGNIFNAVFKQLFLLK